MRIFTLSLLILFLAHFAPAQVREADADAPSMIPFFYGFYGYEWPGGDLKDQFGSNSELGGGFMLKSSSNWLFGGQYNFIFGSNVKNGREILRFLLTSDDNIISADGTPALVASFERGNAFSARFGKLIPVFRDDPNSGLFITAGAGYLMHKVRIEVENENAPQLKGDYKRGYDRLRGGFMASQSLGLMYFGKSRLLNFTVSLEVTEAWTKAYRDYYFDLMEPAPSGRNFDLLIGPRIAWMIPLRPRNAGAYYYY